MLRKITQFTVLVLLSTSCMKSSDLEDQRTVRVTPGNKVATDAGICQDKAKKSFVSPDACASGEVQTKPPVREVINPAEPAETELFSAQQASAQLYQAMSSYRHMIELIEAQKSSDIEAKHCKAGDTKTCFPRYFEDGKIYMEKPNKWTNGFFPGILWMLLKADEDGIFELDDSYKAKFLEVAKVYTESLSDQAHRRDTHDLGFLVYNSFGKALQLDSLDPQLKLNYGRIIDEARASLYSRYDADHGVIKSWDWLPSYKNKKSGSNKAKRDDWTYPVIIDNMMNLEMLLTSADDNHIKVAESHARQTRDNHYQEQDYKAADGTHHSLHIAYHMLNYGIHDDNTGRNWQGLGHDSAWSRGQAWGLYGFAMMAEVAKSQEFADKAEKVFQTLTTLMQETKVPDWDFFAGNANATYLAFNHQGHYHRVLDLCPSELPSRVKPYVGYSQLDALEVKFPMSLLEDMSGFGDIYPCEGEANTEFKKFADKPIAKDSSAAAIIASGLYRLALYTKEARYADFADSIMAELSGDYTAKSADEQKGFLLKHATGNMPSGSEIDTAIIYADYYYIEANMYKIAYKQAQTTAN